MYTPLSAAVDEDETRRLLALMASGNLITATDDGRMATLLPWVLDPSVGEHGALISHIARRNPQWETPWRGEALVIADLPEGYVSAAYYPSKDEHGKVVPTWNYAAVHVYGELITHEDPAWLDDAVRRLSERHEQARPQVQAGKPPWSMDDAPRDYLDGMLQGIVGIEVRISRVEAKVKMSQNKGDADIAGVLAGLESDGRPDLAGWVREATAKPRLWER